MKRFDCLKSLAAMLEFGNNVVTNVGPICREWNALRPSDANLLQVNLGLCAGVGSASPCRCRTARWSCSMATATYC